MHVLKMRSDKYICILANLDNKIIEVVMLISEFIANIVTIFTFITVLAALV